MLVQKNDRPTESIEVEYFKNVGSKKMTDLQKWIEPDQKLEIGL